MILALDRKVLRDFVRLRGQLFAIGMVIAAGAGAYLAMHTCHRSLVLAQASDYARQRFGHVFAGLRRAPELVAERLRAIPGVQQVQTRVVASATLDLPGVVDVVSARLVSLPDHGQPSVNAVRLRSGRMPDPGPGNEVLASEAFAEAHGFVLGTTVGAVIDGRHQRLRIVGTASSPEFIYTLPPGSILPDDRLFGILWMRRATLGPAFDMEGAFNDVSLRTEYPAGRDDDLEEVLARVDAVLARYGGQGAIARKDQQSHFFLSNELHQLRTFGMAVPILFLLVAAFLLNVVLGRIIAAQREQIAALKALGYTDREVGAHFAKLVGVVVGAGLLLGLVVAGWLGSELVGMYRKFYRLPDLAFDMSPAQVVQVTLICAGSAALGTFAAIRRTIRLPPAEAMRPESPPLYRRTVFERLGLDRFVSPAVSMVLRDVERKPLRRLFTLAGMTMAVAMVVVTTFFVDAIDHAMHVTFGLERREDVQLTLVRPRADGALTELEHLPGVRHAEPYRAVPVRFRHGPRKRSASLTGIPAGATLQHVLDVRLAPVTLPPAGVVLSRKLAAALDARVGDTLAVEVLEGHRATYGVEVACVAETFVGLGSYMDLDALCHLLREPRSLNGAWLAVDEDRLPELHRAVKDTPLVAGLSSRDEAMRGYRKMIDENLGTSITINIVFALIMALGILYNAARITLADQARQLASLRVLGFRRREVTTILLGELGALTALAIPLGMVVGYGLAALMVAELDSEQLRIPLVILPRTYGVAAVTVLGAAVFSGFLVWRRLDKMDIIEVLKTHE